MASHHPIRKVVTPPAPVIPDKLYFRIGDVARLCEVPAYVLRFWETEFPQLKPNKGGTGQRLYRKKDVEIALRIKHLLYDEGYTIPGARQVFKAESPRPDTQLRDHTTEPPALEVVATSPGTVSPIEPALPQQARRLRALRDDLRTLAAELAQPVQPLAAGPTAVTTMRPRLVLETKPSRKNPAPLTPMETTPASALHLHQCDLFPAD
jgi:DNA-binding transcriptional MerR regulator